MGSLLTLGYRGSPEAIQVDKTKHHAIRIANRAVAAILPQVGMKKSSFAVKSERVRF